MDSPTAQSLYEDRAERDPRSLAIEVVALRAVLDSLLDNMDNLRDHIIEIGNPTDDPFITVRCAGGLASIQLLHEWVIAAMGNLNDVTTQAMEDWSD